MKIGFFITARLKSSRLKNKILLDLNGKSVLDRVIERCKSVQGIDGVVLCTSTNPQDSILYDNALRNNIQFYPGSEDDVLVRLEKAALYYGYDAFLSITADNPLFSIYSGQLVLNAFRKDFPDFIFSKGLPIGSNITGLKTSALRIANRMKKDTNTEIWGPFVNRPDFFNIAEIHFENSPFNEEKRLTLDYQEDYLLFQKLYELQDNNQILSTDRVLLYLKENPSLWEINGNREQIMPGNTEIENIKKQFDLNKSKGIEYSKSINYELNPSHRVVKV